jgi:hypothetical protein
MTGTPIKTVGYPSKNPMGRNPLQMQRCLPHLVKIANDVERLSAAERAASIASDRMPL